MITLERSPDIPPGGPAPGQWRVISGAVWVSCPTCGQVGTLDHEVAADGTVSPSLVCPRDGCAFHEYVRLAGWEP